MLEMPVILGTIVHFILKISYLKRQIFLLNNMSIDHVLLNKNLFQKYGFN